MSDRDGPFNGCEGASGTGRENDDSNEQIQIRNKNMNLSSQIDRLPNLNSKQLSEGEENVMATLRQSEEGEMPRSLENVEISDDNSGNRPENLSEEANSGLDKHEWSQQDRSMAWKHKSGNMGKIFGSSGEVQSKDAIQKRRYKNRENRRASQNMKGIHDYFVGSRKAAG